MSLENKTDKIDHALKKPQLNGARFPYPESCDYNSITQNQIDRVLNDENNLHPQIDTPLPPISKDPIQLNIDAQLDLVESEFKDPTEVKDKIFGYIMGLSNNLKIHVINYIKKRVTSIIQKLKQEILNGTFTPDDENYLVFVKALNTHIKTRYPLNPDIYKHLIEELFRMHIELNESSSVSDAALLALQMQIQLFASASESTIKIDLPTNLKNSMQGLTKADLEKSKVARSTPKTFPKTKLDEQQFMQIKQRLDRFVERANSFNFYFNTIPELDYAHLGENNVGSEIKEDKEDLFFMICSAEKRKLDELKVNDKAINKHIDEVWEKVIFPQLLLFAYLLFGETQNNQFEWF